MLLAGPRRPFTGSGKHGNCWGAGEARWARGARPCVSSVVVAGFDERERTEHRREQWGKRKGAESNGCQLFALLFFFSFSRACSCSGVRSSARAHTQTQQACLPWFNE
ncbi:hypothetical protein SORBI_3003G268500 [Sorghum bicolor]|uniref:Uncharacterized protein n=1 Tax=Sorghum bicolor TaxID=4558 RepID=C5XHJ4_SORBI|nr:hypothetical protein SORBI_3003G268500 [Sorghum bicolor]